MLIKKIVVVVGIVALISATAFYLLTLPKSLSSVAVTDHQPDLANGEIMFWAGGCASCHAAPDAEDDERLHLVGGVELNTPFGTFRTPNISPDAEHGIGKWTTLDFVNAMVKGVSPEGRHYYPAFPYTNYQNMRDEDLIDLKAYLDGLPAEDNQVAGHTMRFPFGFRRGLGLWKLLYLTPAGDSLYAEASESVQRGRYLVQGPAHCGACHTPRNIFGGEIAERFLAGATAPESTEGKKPGRIPNITPHADGIGSWSESDIVYALETGFDPDYDTFSGSMIEVQENMAKLPSLDREAIAAFLKSIPALPSEVTSTEPVEDSET